MDLKALTTVYSYRHPETRAVIDGLLRDGFPHEVFLRATHPPGYLDGFHEPILERVLDFHRQAAPALGGFAHRYPTSGSEEGIREVMTRLQSEGCERIYVFEGEYEGYAAVAEQRCMQTVSVPRSADPRSLEPGYWFLSNPSAVDGNILPDELVASICEASHELFYDLAYLDSTRAHRFDLSHPKIFAAVISFSKTYGLFYDRVGFTFSREPVPSLYGNKWFKSLFGLLIADAIVTRLAPRQIHARYGPIQAEIAAELRARHDLPLRPSDTFLLAHIRADDARALSPEQRERIAAFRRGQGYRFCLTPYFVDRDAEACELLGRGGKES
ncbi:MAG: hypothetical protein JXR96_10455 [Deltaproteobacteria bacterium]|nr:hypothetical protein [Deltaproteobacteria bacterium]